MRDFEKELELYGVTRRDFLKYCAVLAASLGLSQYDVRRRLAYALESKKPPVIWLEGQDCAGCTISFTGLTDPPVASILLDKISLRYHETIMAAAGQMAEDVLHETAKKGGHVLIVEGSIPEADDRFCYVGGKSFKKIVEECAEKAVAIIATGACAAYGGIPKDTPSKGVGVGKIVKGKTVINLPTCPVHPDHLLGTVVYFLTTGKVPELDEIGRPKIYFGQSIHDNCRRRAHFDAGRFLTDWNDPNQKEYCLIERGCKGPAAKSDCAIRRWNDGINFCIDCGAPCVGCSEPGFYSEMSPIYTAESETSRKIYAMKEKGLL
ncbi:MAG: hydrogenase small subunit [Desulfobacterota bacterium]|nr:hydrogenase small subunit [Thermodesulfobacteriota bacterium]MDW8002602.1 hydrogenase small subunit [Deltaproteobacteria bacterium]